MKIQFGNINGVGSPAYEPKKAPGLNAAKAAEVDKIEISVAQQGVDTQSFIEQLKAQIVNEVRAGVQPHELEDLKQQVATGEYELNIADVARKILCDFE